MTLRMNLSDKITGKIDDLVDALREQMKACERRGDDAMAREFERAMIAIEREGAQEVTVGLITYGIQPPRAPRAPRAPRKSRAHRAYLRGA